MIIYTNGCSHTINLWSEYSWSNIVGKSILSSIDYISTEGIDDIKIKNHTLYNLADSGKGNDKIYHETIEFISRCKNNNVKPNLIIIQWSGPSRFYRYTFENKISFYNPSSNVGENFHFEPTASSITLFYMVSLQEILNNWGVKYFFLNYMELDKQIETTDTIKQLDLNNCISFDESTHPLYDGFRKLMRKRGFVRDGNGHLNFYGAWLIAKKILDKLNINILGFFESLKQMTPYPLPTISAIKYYDDFLITKSKTQKLWESLDEGDENEKKDSRKTIF